jgi:hypothetical protein
MPSLFRSVGSGIPSLGRGHEIELCTWGYGAELCCVCGVPTGFVTNKKIATSVKMLLYTI